MRMALIGLGNVGGKLAGSLLRNGFDLTVRDLDQSQAQALLERGAAWADSPAAMARDVDAVVTCLPTPAASAAVMEGEDGVLAGMRPGLLWLEMSTTDEAEVKRLGAKVTAAGGQPIDCPVSGGCHRAATGNISIFAGGERAAFETVLPVLSAMGRRILHTGPLGSASVLKVVTNYLATANLVALNPLSTRQTLQGTEYVFDGVTRAELAQAVDPQQIVTPNLAELFVAVIGGNA